MLERVWNGNSTLIDDTSAAKVAASVVSLSRDPGEAVASYNYKSGTLSALTGTSAGNYMASLDVTGKTLTIWPASALYGNFANLGAGIWQWDGTNWTQVTPRLRLRRTLRPAW